MGRIEKYRSLRKIPQAGMRVSQESFAFKLDRWPDGWDRAKEFLPTYTFTAFGGPVIGKQTYKLLPNGNVAMMLELQNTLWYFYLWRNLHEFYLDVKRQKDEAEKDTVKWVY